MPRPKRPRFREASRFLYATAFVFSVIVGVITAGLLVLEYPQLTVTARLACGTITVLVSAWFTIRRIRHRQVRS